MNNYFRKYRLRIQIKDAKIKKSTLISQNYDFIKILLR